MNIFFTTRPDHVDKTTSLSRGLCSCVATYLKRPLLFTFGYKGSNGRIFVFFFYGPIEKAVLNPHRHIESSYAWPRPGPSCAFETISFFLVSGFNPYLCLARSDLLLLDFHLGHCHCHHNHQNLCHLHYHLSTLDYKISKYWRVLAKFSNCHQSRSQNLNQNSLKCLAYLLVL